MELQCVVSRAGQFYRHADSAGQHMSYPDVEIAKMLHRKGHDLFGMGISHGLSTSHACLSREGCQVFFMKVSAQCLRKANHYVIVL